MHDHRFDHGEHWRCFRCVSGCVHLVLGGLTLTLTREQFLALVSLTDGMRRELQEEMRSALSASALTSDLRPM